MPTPSYVDPAVGGKRSEDHVIAKLAGAQHGVVARRQLLDAGVGSRAIEHRVERGRLHVVHRGVYAVGHRMLPEYGRWMAAVLAAGPGAVLSHHHAAGLWRIRVTWRTVIDVTCERARRPREGIRAHRAPLPRDETTVHHGIPVTGVSRTVLDLAAVLPQHQLERTVNEVEYLRLSDPVSLDALLQRYPQRHGTPAIRGLLEARRIGRTRSRSDFEAAFIAFLDAHDLSRPRLDVPMALPSGRRIVADAVWHEQRLIVEMDVTATHGSERSFHDDRARDRELQALGWTTIRVTDVHLDHDAERLAADLRALLTAGREPTSRSAHPPAAR